MSTAYCGYLLLSFLQTANANQNIKTKKIGIANRVTGISASPLSIRPFDTSNGIPVNHYIEIYLHNNRIIKAAESGCIFYDVKK